ncbi:MAG: FAD-dependent oxidoreductase [Acidobacteriota bacterium]
MSRRRVVVVGGGIFGAAAAVELSRRGDDVTMVDPGPVPHPLAESTDISKVVRLDYGAEEIYTELAERALLAWRGAELADLFHETGVLFLTRSEIEGGSFEAESLRVLTARGHRVERLDAVEIARRFPAFGPGSHAGGYFNPTGGYAESGRVVERFHREAKRLGARLVQGEPARALSTSGGRIDGVVLASGARLDADAVVIASGAWVPALLPELASCLHPVGQPVFHLKPVDPSPFVASRFPIFCADISRTGYYGFPVNADGIVKVANHGTGRLVRDDAARAVTDDETRSLRAFLESALPALSAAPIVFTRVCVYCDTPDGHFWIDRDPDRPNLVVATGGSGHAFKFAPALGGIVADALDGTTVPQFRWRPGDASPRWTEAARHRESDA